MSLLFIEVPARRRVATREETTMATKPKSVTIELTPAQRAKLHKLTGDKV